MKRPTIGESEITLTPEGVKNSPAKVVPAGSVLVVVRSGVLKHTLPVALTSTEVTVNQDMKALVPTARVDAAYLVRLLKALQPRVLGWVRATTADNFPIGKLLDVEIDLPPIDEQRRIAAILNHADTIRAKRRQILADLETVGQSIFHATLSSIRNTARLRDLGVNFVSGKNVVAEDVDAHPVNRVIKVNAISGGTFLPSETKPMPGGYRPPETHRLRRGDVLFGRASGSLDLLGATAVVDMDPMDLFLPDKVWRLEVREDSPLTPAYALGILRSPSARAYIRHNASGAAGVRNIGKARLLEYVAPVPSPAQQAEYAARMKVVDEQRATAQRSLAVDSELFSSLQFHAFRGEL
jgi:type I restriction enzyme S subunit